MVVAWSLLIAVFVAGICPALGLVSLRVRRRQGRASNHSWLWIQAELLPLRRFPSAFLGLLPLLDVIEHNLFVILILLQLMNLLDALSSELCYLIIWPIIGNILIVAGLIIVNGCERSVAGVTDQARVLILP